MSAEDLAEDDCHYELRKQNKLSKDFKYCVGYAETIIQHPGLENITEIYKKYNSTER